MNLVKKSGNVRNWKNVWILPMMPNRLWSVIFSQLIPIWKVVSNRFPISFFTESPIFVLIWCFEDFRFWISFQNWDYGKIRVSLKNKIIQTNKIVFLKNIFLKYFDFRNFCMSSNVNFLVICKHGFIILLILLLSFMRAITTQTHTIVVLYASETSALQEIP